MSSKVVAVSVATESGPSALPRAARRLRVEGLPCSKDLQASMSSRLETRLGEIALSDIAGCRHGNSATLSQI